jgi:hypothetical protein
LVLKFQKGAPISSGRLFFSKHWKKRREIFQGLENAAQHDTAIILWSQPQPAG